MSYWIMTNEPLVRISAFAGLLIAMALWEQIAPRRPTIAARGPRWVSHLGLAILNTVAVRLLLPATAVGVAVMAEREGWGVINQHALPGWLGLVISLVVLDLVIYLQHVLFHTVPVLWRLHRVHHADLDFDVTTGIRFHPLEILLSMLLKFVAIAALGAPAVAVLTFEVVLNATSMFNHGNVRLAGAIDRWLRWVVVTPDMHRVHHSSNRLETNSNFGFNLPYWDRLFGTYTDQPGAGHDGMEIGIEGWRDEHRLERVPGILLLPFRDGGTPHRE